jgi:hypothetical protein
MSNTLKITFDPDTKFCLLKHGYNKRFSDFMKSGITPLSYRRWVGDRKSWEVHVSRLPRVVVVSRRYFDHVDYSELPGDLQIELVSRLKAFQEDTPVRVKPVTPFEVLHLLPSAPTEVVKAAFKALALLHHPDRGGDEELFKEINSAYETIVGDH